MTAEKETRITDIYDAIEFDHDSHRDLMKSIKESKLEARGCVWKRFHEDV